MKTFKFVFVAGVAMSLLFCFSQARAAATSPQQQVKVSIVIHGESLQDWGNMKGLTPGQVSQIKLEAGGKMGESLVAESIRNFPYAADFDGPTKSQVQTPDGKNISVVIPTTPTEFKTEAAGWSVFLTPMMTGNGVVKLKANAIYSTPNMPQDRGVYGENSGPIYTTMKNPTTGKIERVLLTANHASMPSFQKSETTFIVFAQPGKEYQVKLQCGSEWLDATVRCDLM